MSTLLDPMPWEPGAAPSAPRCPSGSTHSPQQSLPNRTAARRHPSRPDLTGREVEVLLCWIRLDSKTQAAKALYLSLGTVNTHLTRIRAKYTAVGRPAPTKAALVARALQDGLVDISEL